MSFLKNILGAFVEFKEEEQAGESKPAKVVQTPKRAIEQPVVSNPANIVKPTPPSQAFVSHTLAEYQKHFEELIEEANEKNPLFKGTDFKEFIDSKADVDAITDEPAKYKTAFNVLKRTGLTKERLLSTGQEYINIIDADLKAFEGAYQQQYKSDVDLKEKQLQQKTQELQLLNEKIASLNNEMKQMSEEITKSKEQLSTNKNFFLAAGENKKKEIRSELKKIQQYF